MIFVSLIAFSLLYLAPGDPAVLIAGDQSTPEQIAAIRESLGLDRPYLVRFFHWASDVLRGELGTSILTNVPVSTLISQRLEPTISLMCLALSWSVLLGIPLGVLAAWHRGSKLDQIVMAASIVGFSVPVFVLAYCLSYVFSIQLRWLPVQGYTAMDKSLSGWFMSLLLPSLALSAGYIALISRITRAAIIEILQQDYVRTARAKGASPFSIVVRHSIKNAAGAIATVVGLGIGTLMGGAVVTETVFAIPGVGRLTAEAILRRDYPIIQAVTILFSFSYLFINLAIDLLYPLFDPRVKY